MKTYKTIRGCMAYPIGNYLTHNMMYIEDMVDWILILLQEFYSDETHITLVGRGSSGAILAGIIAPKILSQTDYTVNIYIMKKHGENSHYKLPPENISNSVIIVIDDFISSGETMSLIQLHLDNILTNNKQIDIVCVSGDITPSALYLFNCEYLICGK